MPDRTGADALRPHVAELAGGRALVFIARPDGTFADNLKYLLLFFHAHQAPCLLLTFDAGLADGVRALGLAAEQIDAPAGRAALAAARFVFVDDTAFRDFVPDKWLASTCLVQLGSGSPIKRTGFLEAYAAPHLSDEQRGRLQHHHSGFDAVVVASDWFARIAALAWQAGVIVKTGHPRTDVLVRPPTALECANSGVVYDELVELRAALRIGCWAPSGREGAGRPLLQPQEWAAFNEFLQQRDMLLLVKPNLHEPALTDGLEAQQYDRLVPLDPRADLYPLLGLCDFLITDYSPLMFDYLLLDRPLLLFVPDVRDYATAARGFSFDFPMMAGGPLCGTLDQLWHELDRLHQGEDSFALERAQINTIANDYAAGGACARLTDDLLELARLRGLP